MADSKARVWWRRHWAPLTDVGGIVVAVSLHSLGLIGPEVTWKIMLAGAVFGHSDRILGGRND